MIIQETKYLAHYGILRKSGRYPWGSGSTQTERNRTFLSMVEDLRQKGFSETDIASNFNMTTTQLRDAKTIANNAKKQAQIGQAQRLRDEGNSNVAIGKEMGLNESSVRALLAPGQKDKSDILKTTTSMLKDEVAKKDLIDVGVGNERHIGISKEKLRAAIARLQEEGYGIHYVKIDQLGTGKPTTLKVLAAPGVTDRDVFRNRFNIKTISEISDDGGRSYFGIQPPLSISSKRVKVNYADEGGTDADGVVYVRPGVSDVSLGKSRYAQVRIKIDDSHYIKGMAVYKDDLPPGIDLVFNTNKRNTGNKKDAMKELGTDPDNPFGATIRQITNTGNDGKKKVTSAMNLVNEEGDWDKWSRKLSTQILSKQSPKLAQTQLDMTFEKKRDELDQILKLTNPAVRRKLLAEFADSADSSSVHLKAAHLPRQANRVILPVNSLKENEIYAPTFRNGEQVVLIRHPHGGIFEIPELTVNNRNRESKSLIGQAPDAVAIHHKVAQRLSGADFDGDHVIVIPNDNRQIKTKPALSGLKGFDTLSSFPPHDGMKTMGGGIWDAASGKEVFPPGKKASGRTKAVQMGEITNLLADMSIRGANDSELARAVRHSMVVIDAEKHVLNYKQSAIDNGIRQLKEKYQGGARAGASTLVSRAGREVRVADRNPRSASLGGPIDRRTGERVFTPTGAKITDRNGNPVPKTFKSKALAETKDARTLSSGTPIEKVYADHSNRLKAMANKARLEMLNTKTTPYSPSAKAAYAKEVASLDAKLNIALKNAPLERAAHVLGNAKVTQKRQANPDMEASDLKKIKNQALNEARNITGAKKIRIEITDNEWAAIQAGAISNDKLKKILDNAKDDEVKRLATPKLEIKMTGSKKRRAEAMIASGFTQAEIADALGVSLTTLKTSLS